MAEAAADLHVDDRIVQQQQQPQQQQQQQQQLPPKLFANGSSMATTPTPLQIPASMPMRQRSAPHRWSSAWFRGGGTAAATTTNSNDNLSSGRMRRDSSNSWSSSFSQSVCFSPGLVSSPASATPFSNNKRLPLALARLSNGSSSGSCGAMSSVDSTGPTSSEFFFSLHQNFKVEMLYGKNNVTVNKGDGGPRRGYLALTRQTQDGSLWLQWNANDVMNARMGKGGGGGGGGGSPLLHDGASTTASNSTAVVGSNVTVSLQNTHYIHLHQLDDGASLAFVDADGVATPPICIPGSGSGDVTAAVPLLASIEQAVLPLRRLVPPLHETGAHDPTLPCLRRSSASDGSATAAAFRRGDFVFRLVDAVPTRTNGDVELENGAVVVVNMDDLSDVLPPAVDRADASAAVASQWNTADLVQDDLDTACQSVRMQIMARAFMGWLAYSRHLKIIQQHLDGVVDVRQPLPQTDQPVNEQFWQMCRRDPTDENEREFFARLYWNGVQDDSAELRRTIWPYLLNVIPWAAPPKHTLQLLRDKYATDLKAWQSVEERLPSLIANKSSPKDEAEHEGGEDAARRECTTTTEEREHLLFGADLDRVDKDVERCDRRTPFFAQPRNLDALRRVMCTFVWRERSRPQNDEDAIAIEQGHYVQGMCDLVAPFLDLFHEEYIALACFEVQMLRLKDNFPGRRGMEKHLDGLRWLLAVLDPTLHERVAATTDEAQMYFSYRWFLLDFKREFSYADVRRIWETTWACARSGRSSFFALFVATALLTNYRQIILATHMDFADLIKFFNEMSERHDGATLLEAARTQLNTLCEHISHSYSLQQPDSGDVC